MYDNDNDQENRLIELQYRILDHVIEFFNRQIFHSNYHRQFFEIDRFF